MIAYKLADWFCESLLLHIAQNDEFEDIDDPSQYQSKSDIYNYIRNNPECVNWTGLALNPRAMNLLRSNLNHIDWSYLSSNPVAIELLEENFDEIHWGYLSGNPAAIYLLEANQDLIDWESLSINPAAIDLLKQNLDKVDWDALAHNPMAVDLVKNNPNFDMRFLWRMEYDDSLTRKLDFINYKYWPGPNLINMNQSNSQKIIWSALSTSELNEIYPKMNKLDKVNWYDLAGNPNAVDIITANLDKYNFITYDTIVWSNPAIFTYDYEQMKATKDQLHANLIQELYHPARVAKYLETHEDVDEYLC